MIEYTANAVKNRKGLPTAASAVSVLRYIDREAAQVRQRVTLMESAGGSGPGLDADKAMLGELESERSAWRDYLRALSGSLPRGEAGL